MELSQKYVYTVWKEESFSKAAKKLYISQPSLSATVAKLEGELGFPVFDRSTHPITTTAKGRIYLNYLQEVDEAEIQLNARLSAANDMSQGNLTVGGNIAFAQIVFPAVCRLFSQKYPKVSLSLDTNASDEKLRNRLIDMHFTLYPKENEYTVIPIREERLFVAIHKNHPAAKAISDYALSFEELVGGKISPEHEIKDMTLLSDVPFIKSGNVSDSDKRLSMILKEHLTAQYTVINSRTFDARYRMMQQELGAIFASDFYLKQFPGERDRQYYFALQTPYSYRTTYLQYRKDLSGQKLVDEFIATVLEYCKSNYDICSDKVVF